MKTGFAALVLLAISCKKENNNSQSLSARYNTSKEHQLTDIFRVSAIPSIKIGTQRWMTKNLDITRYRNGDKIPQVKNTAQWAALTTGAWCWYNNDSATGAVYGRLYNWYAINDPRGLAPIGWHVSSDSEWITLSTFLGGDAVAGGKLKEAGTSHWSSPNTGTNSSGFTALPGGARSVYGTFTNLGDIGYWWSSSEVTSNAWSRYLYYATDLVYRFGADKLNGFSVRCIKD